jgi:flagellar basal body-associated protein FliL
MKMDNRVIMLVLLVVLSLAPVAVLIWYFTSKREKFEEVKFSVDETNKKIANFEKNKKECSNQVISEEIYTYVVNEESKRPFGR